MSEPAVQVGNEVTFVIFLVFDQRNNFFRLRPGQAEGRQPLVADPGVGAAGAGRGRGFHWRVPWDDDLPA